MCPGVCSGKISKENYQKTIKQIKLFLKGHKKKVITDLKKQMKETAKKLDYENAAKIRDRVFALQHIQDVALITEDDLKEQENLPKKIEAYDVSHISGSFAVGSMVVFNNGLIDKSQYRKFKIKLAKKSDDVGAIKEILSRRLNHSEWPLPDFILIDGGKGQVNGANIILKSRKLDIPVVGIAKGPDRNKNEFIGKTDIDQKLLLRLRDEAHRFAIQYYRLRHKKSFLENEKK